MVGVPLGPGGETDPGLAPAAVRGRGRAVETHVKRDGLSGEHLPQGVLVRNLGNKVAFLEFVVDVAAHG